MAAPSKDPSKPSSAYSLMRPRIDLINTLMGGTEALRLAGIKYLPKHPAESDKNYEERLGRATLTNYFRRTVESLVGKPFSTPIKVGDDMPAELLALVEDIDHQGNHLNVFCKKVFQDALEKGLTHIMVEYPNTIASGITTKEDEAQINATPYFVHIKPENILAAYSEYRNGAEFLTHVRISEIEVRQVGFDEEVIERVRVLEPGTWTLWRKSVKNRWEVEESGTTTLQYIPLLTYYSGGREDLHVAYPPLMDLAYINLAHYQSSADQTNILTVTRFPMLAVSGANEEEAAVKIGPRQLLATVAPDGKYYYVEHSGAAIEAGRNDLKDKQEEMSILGIELLKKSGSATATAKAIDSAENLSMLQSMGILFTDVIEQAFEIAGEWMNLGKPSGSISINSDFGLTLNDTGDLTILQVARTSGEISHEQFLLELQRRGILAEDFDIGADSILLSEEKKKQQEEAAIEFTLQQQGLLPSNQQNPPIQQPSGEGTKPPKGT